jgi:CBS domain-containing protein
MRIADVLRNKGTSVATVSADTTVSALLAGLAEQNIGAMVVTGPGGVEGIVSERDVVRRLHELGASLLSRPVSEIMTRLVATCAPQDSVDDISVLMTQRRVRHVPVLDGDALVGIVSIGDVVKSRIEELEESREQLHAYIANG